MPQHDRQHSPRDGDRLREGRVLQTGTGDGRVPRAERAVGVVVPRPNVQVVVHWHPRLVPWHGSVELVSPQLWSVPVRGDVLVLVHDEVLDAGQLASLRPALVEILGADPATIAVAVDAERLSDISQERVALASQQPLR